MALDREPLPLTFSEILAASRRHPVIGAVAFLSVMALVVMAIWLWPRKYASEGKMFVQLGRTSVSVDPTANAAENISIQDSRATEINSVAELIGSRATLMMVVEDLGAERILPSGPNWLGRLKLPSASGGEPAAEGGMSAEEIAAQRLKERAVKHLQSALRVEAEDQTSVISVWCALQSPTLARDVVQSLMTAYQKVHLDVNTTKGSREFFDEQYRQHVDNFNAAQLALAEFCNERQFLSVEGARQSLQGVMTNLERDMVEDEIRLAQTRERLAQLDEQMRAIDQTVEKPTTGMTKPSSEAAVETIYRLEAERARILATHTPEHPRAIEIQDQLAKLRTQLADLPVERTERVTEPNAVYTNLQVTLVTTLAEARALEARLASVHAKYDESRERLAQLNSDAAQVAKLQQDIEVARMFVDLYAKKRGEANVLAALDREHISNVVVAQPASLQLKHVSPRGSLVMAAGGLLAVFVALATVVAVDRRRGPPQVAREMSDSADDLPVMVTLPRVTGVERASIG